jgi:succinate dehydrogenase / fumarate reductase cytochrome b subunit
MGWFFKAITTSVGRKGIMAVTGTIMLLFVFVHMLGNTHLWEGPKEGGLTAMDHYAHLLRTFPTFLWVFRIVMLGVALLHVTVGVWLWIENRAARPAGYTRLQTVKATFASRTMIWSGAIIMGFLVYHLLNLTFGTAGPVSLEEGSSMVFNNVVDSFKVPWISVLYIVGQILLYFHLSHGISSLFQTLGFRHPKYIGAVERGGMLLAFLICAINILFPISVLLGWVG